MTPRSSPARSRLRTGEKPSRGPAFLGCRGHHVRKGPLGLPHTPRERSSRRRARRRRPPPAAGSYPPPGLRRHSHGRSRDASGPVMTTAGLACRPGGLHRLGRAVRGAALSGACLAGVAAAGAVVSGRATYPRPRPDVPGRPAAAPAPAVRMVVAVVLGPRGSVGTDALGPYEVFARSPAFLVYTVAPGRAASVLSGGLALVPEHSLEDVDAGLVPEPDVVVVPAVARPEGKEL